MKVTKEMISAGVEILANREGCVSQFVAKTIVVDVFLAMIAVANGSSKHSHGEEWAACPNAS